MNTGKGRPAVSALALLVTALLVTALLVTALLATVLPAAGCGGQGESEGGGPGGAGASAARSAQAGSVTVATLSFVPPDKMVRIEPTEQDVVLEMSLGGATDAPGQDVPPPGVQVFQGGRDLASVSVRVGLIEARLKADAPDAQVRTRWACRCGRLRPRSAAPSPWRCTGGASRRRPGPRPGPTGDGHFSLGLRALSPV
ncbi:hypothetical protein [Actinomadura madurae]|uniref:hypothetical protein n=1 Tax=Actinomadura madurae TaxID=1993 RepID=UPI0020D21B14|nr:hypothetical protein [Actinomadura madurae]MCP9950187.1 hypothetical protein [Actinomadura madurae]MCP9966955.1 hypothetical protein [Actinomadura madurae]MCP9979426.1 hypothetical protein [Actinomadura madurae]MCQ0009044.1 hypothetical protein [Actinomadura madurae]